MKNTMLKSISLVSISFILGLSVTAQEPKIKTTDKEEKYKSEELKTKVKKGEVKYKSEDLKEKVKKDETKYKTEDLKVKVKKDETKYKTEDLKVKVKKDETKYKTEGLKIKDKEDERKVKADDVKPMRKTMTERTELKTGKTHVTTKEQIAPVAVQTAPAEPIVAPVPVPAVVTPVRKTTTRKYTTHKKTYHKPATARKTNTGVKYITRTKIVKDTVFVPSPPERIVSTKTEYLHDTVTVTRVDTVTKIQKVNTYTGYNVPKGDFKKVKLKRDKQDGTMHMKTKTDK